MPKTVRLKKHSRNKSKSRKYTRKYTKGGTRTSVRIGQLMHKKGQKNILTANEESELYRLSANMNRIDKLHQIKRERALTPSEESELQRLNVDAPNAKTLSRARNNRARSLFDIGTINNYMSNFLEARPAARLALHNSVMPTANNPTITKFNTDRYNINLYGTITNNLIAVEKHAANRLEAKNRDKKRHNALMFGVPLKNINNGKWDGKWEYNNNGEWEHNNNGSGQKITITEKVHIQLTYMLLNIFIALFYINNFEQFQHKLNYVTNSREQALAKNDVKALLYTLVQLNDASINDKDTYMEFLWVLLRYSHTLANYYSINGYREKPSFGTNKEELYLNEKRRLGRLLSDKNSIRIYDKNTNSSHLVTLQPKYSRDSVEAAISYDAEHDGAAAGDELHVNSSNIIDDPKLFNIIYNKFICTNFFHYIEQIFKSEDHKLPEKIAIATQKTVDLKNNFGEEYYKPIIDEVMTWLDPLAQLSMLPRTIYEENDDTNRFGD
jgi:hypothetical protein